MWHQIDNQYNKPIIANTLAPGEQKQKQGTLGSCLWEEVTKLHGAHDSNANQGDLENVTSELCQVLSFVAQTQNGKMLLNANLLFCLKSKN
jgi:hypothetical protein